ncbi:Rap1a/Tai family immunity protein [Photobacterium rosenbergii]|uniref:Rap1a/Tai family immunity protein n=1 Tax=Photobacterium rosenbergii TaxID=294936 RepID=A0ABU3ZFK1_9GAMM|nr:Rap1a/Tai family immunity protein [Photobacterium rosenbergii]MDV5168886.1 Rap1a/Tai family immunity protein [Photobacterium rosenbergii]
MRKVLVLLSILSLSVLSLPLKANQMLATPMLLKACNAPEKSRDFGVCLGFFTGVVQSSIPATIAVVEYTGAHSEESYQKAAVASGKVFGCGEHDTILNSIEKYKVFMQNHANYSDLPASVTVAKMLSTTYPCK